MLLISVSDHFDGYFFLSIIWVWKEKHFHKLQNKRFKSSLHKSIKCNQSDFDLILFHHFPDFRSRKKAKSSASPSKLEVRMLKYSAHRTSTDATYSWASKNKNNFQTNFFWQNFALQLSMDSIKITHYCIIISCSLSVSPA